MRDHDRHKPGTARIGAAWLRCLLLVGWCWLLATQGAAAASPVAGRYRLVEAGPDVAAELVLRPDGRFEYGRKPAPSTSMPRGGGRCRARSCA